MYPIWARLRINRVAWRKPILDFFFKRGRAHCCVRYSIERVYLGYFFYYKYILTPLTFEMGRLG